MASWSSSKTPSSPTAGSAREIRTRQLKREEREENRSSLFALLSSARCNPLASRLKRLLLQQLPRLGMLRCLEHLTRRPRFDDHAPRHYVHFCRHAPREFHGVRD